MIDGPEPLRFEPALDEAAKLERYARQLALPGFAKYRQQKLFAGRVLVLGAGAIARTLAMNLVQSGVGQVKIVSPSLSDLSGSRNFLATVENPDSKLTYQLVGEPLTGYLEELISLFDVVVDAACDWQIKLLASDLVMRANRPLVHAHTDGLRCHVYCMVPGRSMCLRCLLVELEMEDYPREGSNHASSLPSLDSIVGGFQSLEVIKLLSGFGVSQGNELMQFDGLSGELEVLRGLDPRSDCPDCGRRFFT